MPKPITISDNKTLKLSNVLIKKIQEDEFTEFGKIVELMENYVKSKGAVPIGPLVQYTKFDIDEEGNSEVNVILLRQADKFINHVESPYKMKSIMRVKNCLYAHFVGEESKLQFAYDKMSVYAYENDINLTGENYTVFVNQIDDDIVADIFMERADNE
ncbi:MAG: hypothetical protein UHK60_04730 [Acutalibacteraceae bacterium]|nr:hypothetical protein [Acutalibacteraceae bacterium]